MARLWAPLVLLLACASLLHPSFAVVPKPKPAPPKYGVWQAAFTATYYGGQGDGGSCGYGTAAESGYGVKTASASPVLYKGGVLCGACFKVQCVNSRLCTGAVSPVVTVSNLCPSASSGGHCAFPLKSFSLAPAVWNQIASNPNIGVVPVRVQRVACWRAGSPIFTVFVGNPSFLQIMIKNVAGSGDLTAVALMLGSCNPYCTGQWLPMMRGFGSVWQLSGTALSGRPMSFRLTTGYVARTIIVKQVIPAGYAIQYPYSHPAGPNFPLIPGRALFESEIVNATLMQP